MDPAPSVPEAGAVGAEAMQVLEGTGAVQISCKRYVITMIIFVALT